MSTEANQYRELFGTLANASRMAIVQLLRRRGSTVTQIAETLGFEQSRVSHSLARLQHARLVGCRWEDKRKIFHLVDDVPEFLREADAFLQRRQSPAAKPNGGLERELAVPATAWADAQK